MKSFTAFLFLLAFTLVAATGFSQPVLTAGNLSMGGGGTAYLTGYEASFLNPANLMIRTRNSRYIFGIGETGYTFNPVIPPESPAEQTRHFQHYLDSYRPGSGELTPDRVEKILERNYHNNRMFSEHQHRLDVIWAGFQYQHDRKAFSFTARTRMATRTEVGRGWYDDDFFEQRRSSQQIRDMRLIQQSQFLYEFSFGYARHFQFVSGLIPRLGELYIGIAPKFIVGGTYLDFNYQGKYLLSEPGIQPERVHSFSYLSAGNVTQATTDYRQTGNAEVAIDRNFSSSIRGSLREQTQPTGYGAGFDFGLTYLLLLGSDIDMPGSGDTNIHEKSLRLGFSVTDIGFVRYSRQPLSFNRSTDTLMTVTAPTAGTAFEGLSGEYLAFFDEAGGSLNPLTAPLPENRTSSSFSVILPTSLNMGMLLQINRLKLSADLLLGLNDTAFNNTKLSGHLGMEFRPVRPIPVRLGTRIAAGEPTLFSLGTGLMTRNMEISAGTQFSIPGPGSPGFSGAALGGLKFYF